MEKVDTGATHSGETECGTKTLSTNTPTKSTEVPDTLVDHAPRDESLLGKEHAPDETIKKPDNSIL